MSVFYSTDRPELAEMMAPLDEEKPISDSMHDAQLATERIMGGLPFTMAPKMILEDYVKVWIADMSLIVQGIEKSGGMATAEQITGLGNLGKHIDQFLQVMAQNDDEKDKVRAYAEALASLMNMVKAFAQRLAEQMKSEQDQQQQGGGVDPETQTKLQGKLMIDQAKAQNMRESHATKTAQRQVQFELDQQRKDREHADQMRRDDLQIANEIELERIKALNDAATKVETTPE